MTGRERIKALLKEWVAATNAGRSVPLEQLCRDCPELLPEVRRRVDELVAEAKAKKAARKAKAEPTRSAAEPAGEGTQVQGDPPSFTPPLGDHYPTELGGYKLCRVLGEGGMGRVYLAEDPRLGRQVAVKVMKPDVASNRENRERFIREAKATAALEHDHVVSIYLVGEEKQIPYLVMPLLKGEALDSRLKREGKQSLKEALRIAREMAEGLACAHERGLIHRDIKPANVWLDGSKARVKILDFGLAKGPLAGGEENLTQSGAVMGTPAYMSPEQARGLPVDRRADLFSLGCVLYQMLTGKRPFTGSDTLSILSSLAMDTPDAPQDIDHLCPPDVSRLTMKLLEKLPNDRPSSAAEVAATIQRIEEGLHDSTRVAPGRSAFAEVVDEYDVTQFDVEPVATKSRRPLWIALGLILLLGPLGFLLLKGSSGTDKGDDGKGKSVAKADSEKAKEPGKEKEKEKEKAKPEPKREPHALELKGGGSQVLFDDLRYDDAKPLTVEFWVRNDPGPLRFYLRGKGTRSFNVYRVNEIDWRYAMLEGTAGKGGVVEVTSERGKWLHLAAVIDEGKAQLYLNGRAVAPKTIGTGSYPQTPNWQTNLASWAVKGVEPTGVLVRGLRVSESVRYTGDFVPPERFVADAATTGLYDFEDGTGKKLADRSGAGHDGTISDATWVKLDPKDLPAAKPVEPPKVEPKEPPKPSLDADRKAAEYTFSAGGFVRVNGQPRDLFAVEDLPKAAFRLTDVFLHDNQRITDDGLKIFATCKNLTQLSLFRTPIGDAGLIPFKAATGLKSLNLQENAKITPAGLIAFKDCKELEILKVRDVPFEDGSLDVLKGLTKLKEINLRGTKFTEKGISDLQKLFPAAAIDWTGKTSPKK